MSDIKGLIVDEKMKSQAQKLFMIWIQFNQANETANCIGLVNTGIDTSIGVWPGMRKSGSGNRDVNNPKNPHKIKD